MLTTIYTVYQTTNTINNKIYIGVHATTNPNDAYLGSGILLKQSIKKHGKDNFTKSILFECDTQNEAYLKETKIVNQKFIDRKDNYNMCVGGKGASMGNNIGKGERTTETKNNISKSLIGHIVSDKSRKLFIDRNTGKNSYRFKGYYVTPYGKFETSRLASTIEISHKAILRWCKDNHKTIIEKSIIHSPYLSSLPNSPLGKTYKEIGFDFIRC